MLYYLNGSFVDQEDARIHVHDLGLLRGYAVYECFRCYGNQPFCLDAHLDRFYISCKNQGLTLKYTKQELKSIINTLMEKNAVNDLVFKLFLTGGASDDHISFESKESLIIICHKQRDLAPVFYEKGYKVKTIHFERQNPTIKTTAYSIGIQNVASANKEGFNDCLYLDSENYMLELTTSNLFFIKNSTLFVPNKKILFGMTRYKTLEIAKQLNLKIYERPVHYDELSDFSEIFCTSTLKKILPIQQIDQYHFTIGSITKIISKAFDSITNTVESIC